MSRQPLRFVPRVLQWARKRAGLKVAKLADKMKVGVDKVEEWEKTGLLSLSRAKKLATQTRTPLGYLFLDAPLDDKLPIPDFRTIPGTQPTHPSLDLLEVVQDMQRRQEWMRDFLIEDGVDPLPFVGNWSPANRPEEIAASIRDTLGLEEDWAKAHRSWTDALRHLRIKIEDAGILMFITGIVGNNTHRPLNPEEFRGFVICDDLAPLIFINGADTKSAQMFTVAHELAHIWIGRDGVSNLALTKARVHDVESFCNKVAAEVLVPGDKLKKSLGKIDDFEQTASYISRLFKVSPIVAARRCLDLDLISKEVFFDFYKKYTAEEYHKARDKKSGGNFWKTQAVRLGKRFGMTVVAAAQSGRLLYRDAYRLTGLKGATFDKYAKEIGIPPP